MVLIEIEELRQELYKLISQNDSYENIYKISIELDKLINEYYNVNKITA